MEKKKYIHNNSTDYYTQINNKRDPYVTCFNTSMVNVGLDIMKLIPPTSEDKTGGYTQPEDQFDWFIHNSPEIKEWFDKYCADNPWVKTYVNTKGNDMRELWEVEAYCFNKWIGRNVCRINYKMSRHDFIEEIQNGRGVVTTGKFYGFAHAVSVVGFTAEVTSLDSDLTIRGSNISIPITVSCDEVNKIIVDDSYGNPNNKYKPVGIGGNDVHLQKETFFTAINKGSSEKEIFYGILFDLA